MTSIKKSKEGQSKRQKQGAKCTIAGCSRKPIARQLCRKHYQRARSLWAKQCKVMGCTRYSVGHGFCSLHYGRFKTHGDPLKSLLGERGKGCRGKDGYIRINRRTNSTTMQHRLIMEKLIGRPLRPEETVHHKNGVRDDNREANLELWSSSHPKGQSVTDKVLWAREIITMYGVLVDKELKARAK